MNPGPGKEAPLHRRCLRRATPGGSPSALGVAPASRRNGRRWAGRGPARSARYSDSRLRETLAQERARLLAGQTRPPRRKVALERVIKRLWRKSAQTRSMEERDELHRMLREIEARIAEVEGFLRGIGVDPWA